MTEPQSESAFEVLPPRGVPTLVLPVHVEQHWQSVEWRLKVMEEWTQLCSANDVRQGIAAGKMQMWAVLDHAGKLALAIMKVTPSRRGQICTLFLVASHFADDQSISSLIDECESCARQMECSVLEINASPLWAERLRGRLTAVIVERDLRIAQKVN